MSVVATVIGPGLLTTIQDAGRPGARHLGVPRSGAADLVSFALANIAVGNPWSAPALECALAGPTLRFERSVRLALAGADMGAALDSRPVERWRAVDAQAEQKLELGGARLGARCYIAVAGGFAADRFLASAATFAPGGLGGFDGRALDAGDALSSEDAPAQAEIEAPAALRQPISADWVLRATPGPEGDRLDAASQRALFGSPFVVGRDASRMGARLDGPALQFRSRSRMESGPVFPGVIQCPEGGAPILLLADAQTTGGYPRAAQVIAADLPAAGQMRPGDRVWFRETGVEAARRITAGRRRLIAAYAEGFSFFGSPAASRS